MYAVARNVVKAVPITSADVLTSTLDQGEWALSGLTFAKTSLSAISMFTWSPETSEARRFFKALPPKEDSSFRRGFGAVNLN